MSPRPAHSHSRNNSSPYSRRAGSQPKSSRQQFSACGACRMRRVRCDLKDLPHSSEPRPCSNCRERGLNCVDEYADMKAVKLLRRGRRLQQVEAVYGKAKSADASTLTTKVSSQIPILSPDFFSSPFWTWFCVQRPILDSSEFSQRYIAHIEGTRPLGYEGGILAMLLVLWAATFGVDEFGSLIKDDRDDSATSPTSRAGHTSQKSNIDDFSITKPGEVTFRHVGKRNREKTSFMLREILELIDFHGVMRRPTFDGVRILLLTLPLMEEAPHLERTAMYEAALSQARTLCAPIPKPTLPSALPPFSAEESVLRSRIYLYTHTLEGISTAIKGGYLVYHNDDVDTLRRMVYLSPERIHCHQTVAQTGTGNVVNGGRTIAVQEPQLSHLSTMALRLSNVCRKVHDVLTGPKAARRIGEHNLVDATGMREIWQELDQCWHGFSAMKNNSAIDSDKVNIYCFVDAWLIFIFECHNIILEHLKHFASAEDSPLFSHSASPSSSSPYLSPREFHLEAKARCIQLLPNVLRVIRYHLIKTTKGENLNLFAWDTGLVRDGCFFAALLSISLQEDSRYVDDHGIKVEESDDSITHEEGVHLCLSALAEMRWVFSKSDERIETIRAALKNMNEKQVNLLLRGTPQSASLQRLGSSVDNGHCPPCPENFPHGFDAEVVTDARERQRSLSVSIRPTRRRAESAPDISCNTAGVRIDDWPTYTPPTTASTVDNGSSPATRAIASPASYNSSHDDPIFCYVPETLDHFAYTSLIAPGNIPAAQALYHHRNAFLDTRDVQDVSDGLSPCAFTSTESSLQLTSDIDSYVNDFYT